MLGIIDFQVQVTRRLQV